MKINEVSIQHMHNVDDVTYDFSDVNYISGENGAGKSTILEAIQLAILGYIPGYNKRNTDIMKHSNADTMLVHVEFDTGDYITRKYTKVRSSVNCEVDSSFGTKFDLVNELEMPIYNFSSFLEMSPNEQKKWFISYLPKEENDLNWRELLKSKVEDLPEYSKDIYEEIIEGIEERNLTDVNDVYEYIKSMISFVNGQIKAKNNILSDMSYYEDIDEYDENEIKDQLEEENDIVSQDKIILQNYEGYVSGKKQILELKDKLIAESLDEDEEYLKIKTELDEYSTQLQINEEKLQKLNEELDKLKQDKAVAKADMDRWTFTDTSSNNICPVIPDEIECDKLKEYQESYTSHLKAVKEIYNDADSKCTECNNKISDLTNDNNKLVLQIDKLTDRQHEIEGNYKAYEQVRDNFNQMFRDTQVVSGLKEDDLKQQIEFEESEVKRLQDILTKIYANQKYKELQTSNEVELSKYENELVILKRLQDYTGPNELQQELLAKPFINLQNDITEYLKQMFNSEDVSCYMNLSSKSNSFEFGVLRENIEIPFTVLSSGEKCMYMLALQASIIARNPLGIDTLMVDDVFDHLDEENMEFLVEAILNTDIQYIIAGVAEIPEIDKFKDLNRIEL